MTVLDSGRFAHPRLLLVTAVGALIALAGLGTLLLSGPAHDLLGRRIVFAGGILLAYGTSGYLAFGVFTRRDRPD